MRLVLAGVRCFTAVLVPETCPDGTGSGPGRAVGATDSETNPLRAPGRPQLREDSHLGLGLALGLGSGLSLAHLSFVKVRS